MSTDSFYSIQQFPSPPSPEETDGQRFPEFLDSQPFEDWNGISSPLNDPFNDDDPRRTPEKEVSSSPSEKDFFSPTPEKQLASRPRTRPTSFIEIKTSTQRTPTIKRKLKFNMDQTTELQTSKKVRFDIKEKLSEKIGYLQDLSISSFINDYDSDPLVRDYVDKLLENPTIKPVLPSIPEMKNALEFETTFLLSPDHLKFAVMNFMSYFQVKYFHNNMEKSTANNKAVLNPQSNLHIPQFGLVPERTLNLLTETKKAFSIHTQAHVVEGSEFTLELLLLKITHRIISALPASLPDKMEHFYAFYASAFFRAQMEFKSQYKCKMIDWSERSDKCRHIQPSWRKGSEQIPPVSGYIHCANKIINKIENNQVDFTGSKVKADYEDFLNKGAAYVNKLQSKIKSKNEIRSNNGEVMEVGETQETEPNTQQLTSPNLNPLGSKGHNNLNPIFRGRGNFRGRGQRGSRNFRGRQRGFPSSQQYRNRFPDNNINTHNRNSNRIQIQNKRDGNTHPSSFSEELELFT